MVSKVIMILQVDGEITFLAHFITRVLHGTIHTLA